MAVVAVNIKYDREVTEAVGGRVYRYDYDVIVDSMTTPESEVLAAPGLPQQWDEHPSDSTVIVMQRSARRSRGDALVWRVQIQYSEPRGDPLTVSQSPLLRPVQFAYDFMEFQEVMSEDADGTAVLNSAGVPFDPPVMQDKAHLVVRVSRNEATYNVALKTLYSFAVNDDTFWGVPANTLLCRPIRATWQREQGYSYWAVNYEIVYNPDTWSVRLLDAGWQELDDGALKTMIDADGNAYNTAQLLDGSGGKLEVGGTPVYKTFKRGVERDFALLGLPDLPA